MAYSIFRSILDGPSPPTKTENFTQEGMNTYILVCVEPLSSETRDPTLIHQAIVALV